MRELRVEYEECEERKCLVLAALFVEAEVVVVVVADAAAAHCLSVIEHGQLTSLHQSAATLGADASCETGAVLHRIVDK
jgi:hypothetical protein